MSLIDISLPLHPGLAPWPGDTPFTFVRNARKAEGASVNLGSICMSVHVGTHADAPYHFHEEGAMSESFDLSTFIGPAIVVDVSGRDTITPQDFDGLDLRATPRVLLKTGAWTDYARFPAFIPTLHPDMPAYLHAQGVLLVGFDVPSVDVEDSKDLPIHHALGDYRISILEGLLLRDVPCGVYELLALPLNIIGADGAPVRAVLRTV